MSSVDVNGNLTTNNTTFNLPIDNVAPTVSVVAGADITQGQTASFTVTVTETNFGTINYSVATSGAETASYNCTSNPCNVTTATIVNTGSLTLSVAIAVVSDSAGNSNASLASDNLTVVASGALAIGNPLPTLNSQNASSYPVSGMCDDALGDVTLTVGTPNQMQNFTCVSPGTFSGNMTSLGSVTANPAVISATQAGNTVSASPQPVNDQTPITNAPSIGNQSGATGTSTTFSMTCSEVGEVVSFTSAALDPSPQAHTCTSISGENVTLDLASGQDGTTASSVTVASEDVNGNPTTNSGSFNLTVDNIAPTVSIAAGSDVTLGTDATFTVTVTEATSFADFTPTTSNGTVSSGACSSSPCTVTVTGIDLIGPLTLSVAIAGVADAAGNTNIAAASDSLEILGDIDYFLVLAHENSATSTTADINGTDVVYGNLVNATDAGSGEVQFAAGTNQVYSQTASSTNTIKDFGEYYEVTAAALPNFTGYVISWSSDETANASELNDRIVLNRTGSTLTHKIFIGGVEVVSGTGSVGVYRIEKTGNSFAVSKDGAVIYDGATGAVLNNGAYELAGGLYKETCQFYVDSLNHNPGDGLYKIDPDGAGALGTTDVYCDMSTPGEGWTLIASSTVGDGATPIIASVADTDTNGILSAAVVAAIGANTSAVRINSVPVSNEVLEVVSIDSTIISRFANYEMLNLNSVTCAGSPNKWTGSGSGRIQCTCTPSVLPLNDKIYHACGNGGNLHWISDSNSGRWTSAGGGTGDNMNLWAR